MSATATASLHPQASTPCVSVSAAAGGLVCLEPVVETATKRAPIAQIILHDRSLDVRDVQHLLGAHCMWKAGRPAPRHLPIVVGRGQRQSAVPAPPLHFNKSSPRASQNSLGVGLSSVSSHPCIFIYCSTGSDKCQSPGMQLAPGLGSYGQRLAAFQSQVPGLRVAKTSAALVFTGTGEVRFVLHRLHECC